MYVGTCHLVGLDLDPTTRDGMRRYFANTQNADGGWGLHNEGPSHVFTTLLAYVATRQLGVPPDSPQSLRARKWLAAHGGPTASASWGKFFLAVQGLYSFSGLNPVLPELWLLPRRLPIHPSRLWCHSRVVYLPMAWLYGARAHAPESELVEQLRKELYPAGFDRVDWRKTRDHVSETDAYAPHSTLLRAANRTMLSYEHAHSKRWRRRALDAVLDHIDREDRNTSYLCIGPVNKLYHTLVWHFARPGGTELSRHLERLPEYLSHHPLGTRMNGYNGSQLWDTAFATQALAEVAPQMAGTEPALSRAFGFIERTQVREDVPDRETYFRDPSRGGWPFSTRDHGWPITDCTAEAIKACLATEAYGHSLAPSRLQEAVELILRWQNANGGWATYERTRGPGWLELLNPSDAFARIMVDYPWVECTSACVQALAAYRNRFGDCLGLDRAIARGAEFIRSQQRSDGSWEGNWGVCFTYGTWFGVSGLRAAGLPSTTPAIQAAADYLVRMQGEDGGWGESVASCRERRYVATSSGQAVMTSWALLALVAAGRAASEASARGAQFLLRRQLPDGRFPPEGMAGVFNRTCGIHYDNYLGVFPLWALARLRAELAKPRSDGSGSVAR